MRNLAGDKDCDRFIADELRRAGIPAVATERSPREVAACIEGRLGPFRLSRAWYYWVAEGPMPVEWAWKIYDDPAGPTDVRVAGHCGGVPPEDPWVDWLYEGKKVVRAEEREEFEKLIAKGIFDRSILDGYVFDDDPRVTALRRGYVNVYHIDSELGLRVFADTARAARLAP